MDKHTSWGLIGLRAIYKSWTGETDWTVYVPYYPGSPCTYTELHKKLKKEGVVIKQHSCSTESVLYITIRI